MKQNNSCYKILLNMKAKCIQSIEIVLITVFLVITQYCPAFADDVDDNEIKPDIGTIATTNVYTAEEMLKQYRFNYEYGHGFAAEEGNNLIDRVLGKDAKIVGYDNATNGADRLIITRTGEKIFIQDKYCFTAQKTVDACFDKQTGMYRYLDGNGKPMQLEVPADQYENAVSIMKDKIRNGLIEGVSDPEEANNLVRKGHLTYKQAVNLTKAGNIDSLLYDASKGTVMATTAFGISTTLDFAIRKLNGESWNEAIKNSAMVGLKTGATSFAIYVITSQLSRTGVQNVFTPATSSLIKTFGDDFAKNLVKAYGVNSLTTKSARKAAEKLLNNQALGSVVSIVVITTPDVVDLIRGRISAKQLLKDLAVTTAGVAGGTVGSIAGSAAGTAIAPGVGSTVGGIAGGVIGGAAAGYGAELLLDVFMEDDAELMLQIIQDEFYNLSVDYLVTEDEAELIANELSTQLTGKKLKDMFASEDRNVFAVELMTPLFDSQVSQRSLTKMPTNDEMRYELKNQLSDVVFIH